MSEVATLDAYPADFRWGVATAAYQIEGAAGRGTSIWDTFVAAGRTFHGDGAALACDHYARWEQDFDLMAALGIRDYRLSLSWSRLQPRGREEFDTTAVAFYRAQLAGLRDRGIRALVTLYHWDLPQPLEDAGGWPVRATAHAFEDYARRAFQAFGDLVDEWVTLNESWCVSFLGYGTGAHAPGRAEPRAAVAAAHHTHVAHGLALRAARELVPHARVGVTHLVTDLVPRSGSAADAAAVRRLDAGSNRAFLDPLFHGGYSDAVLDALGPLGLTDHVQDGDFELIAQPIDFLGVNHYQRIVVWDEPGAGYLGVGESPSEPAPTSFGWSVIPESLSSVLERISDEYTDLPLYVTESGASYHDYADPEGRVKDPERVDYFGGYLTAAGHSIRRGVNLKGYYAWSLLDNFEWAEGYSKRFGLVYVDYRTQERIPKDSAYWYRDLIARHAATAAGG